MENFAQEKLVPQKEWEHVTILDYTLCNGADADINQFFQSLNFFTAPHRRNAL